MYRLAMRNKSVDGCIKGEVQAAERTAECACSLRLVALLLLAGLA